MALPRPIFFVQGDTLTQIRAVLTREESGNIVNLAQASQVKLYVKRRFAQDLTFTAVGEIQAGGTGGEVIFSFADGQFDIAAGEYQGELEVIYIDGTRESTYDIVDIVVREDFE